MTPDGASALSIRVVDFNPKRFLFAAAVAGPEVIPTLAGKGDSGLHAVLPAVFAWAVYGTTIPWMIFYFGALWVDHFTADSSKPGAQ